MNNNHGFTLISSLMALSLSSFIILLILSLTQIIYKSGTYDEQHHASVYVFLNQISREIRSADTLSCTSGTLTLGEQNKVIDYHLSGIRLIREVNQSGYDIALENVTSIHFKCAENYAGITVNPGWGYSVNWSELRYTGGSYAP